MTLKTSENNEGQKRQSMDPQHLDSSSMENGTMDCDDAEEAPPPAEDDSSADERQEQEDMAREDAALEDAARGSDEDTLPEDSDRDSEVDSEVEEVEEYVDEGRPDDAADLARRAAALPLHLQPVYRLLQVLMSPENHVHNWPFMNAVDSKSVWDYEAVVTKPVWLKKIRETLLQQGYDSPTAVFADLRLMLRNCYRYNGPSHSVTRRALRLEHTMEQLIEQLEPELRAQCTLEATEGAEALVDPKIVNRRRSVRNKTPGFFSHVLHWVRHERADREKEFRRQQLETKRQQRQEKEGTIVAWETRLLRGATGDWLCAMWELPQLAQFIHLSLRTLNIFEVPLYELERMFLVPQSSETLAMLMTSLVSNPLIRTKLSELPPMPYHMWTEKLAARVQLWYRAYAKEGGRADRLLDTHGIEPDFWRVLGPSNPFEDRAFHQLSYYQRVWMVKTMCDFLFHNHKTIQECVMETSLTSPREAVLGTDRHGYEYLHLPQLLVQDVRLYRRRPWRAPDHWRGAEPPAPPPPPPLRVSQLGPKWTRARLEKFRKQLTQMRRGTGRRGGGGGGGSARKPARRAFACLGGAATPAGSPSHSEAETSEPDTDSGGATEGEDEGPEFTLTRSGRKSQRPPRATGRRSAPPPPPPPQPETPSRRGKRGGAKSGRRSQTGSRSSTPAKQPPPSPAALDMDVCPHCGMSIRTQRARKAHRCFQEQQALAAATAVTPSVGSPSPSASDDSDDAADSERAETPVGRSGRGRGRGAANRGRGSARARPARGRARATRSKPQPPEEAEEEVSRSSVGDGDGDDQSSRLSPPALSTPGGRMSRLSAPDLDSPVAPRLAPELVSPGSRRALFTDERPECSPPRLAPAVSPPLLAAEDKDGEDSRMEVDEGDDPPAPPPPVPVRVETPAENGDSGSVAEAGPPPPTLEEGGPPPLEDSPPSLLDGGAVDAEPGVESGADKSPAEDGDSATVGDVAGNGPPLAVDAADGATDGEESASRGPPPPVEDGVEHISGKTVSEASGPTVNGDSAEESRGRDEIKVEPSDEAMDADDVHMTSAEGDAVTGRDAGDAKPTDFKGIVDGVKSELGEAKTENGEQSDKKPVDTHCQHDQKPATDNQKDSKLGTADMKLGVCSDNQKTESNCLNDHKPGTGDQKSCKTEACDQDQKMETDHQNDHKLEAGDHKTVASDQKLSAEDAKPAAGDVKLASADAKPAADGGDTKSDSALAPVDGCAAGDSATATITASAAARTAAAGDSSDVSGAGGSAELAVPEPVPEPEHLETPDPDQFQLVASTFDGLRKLVDAFDPETAAAAADNNSKKSQKPPACEVELHKELKRILQELEPLEAKINISVRKMRKRLCQEWLNFVERPADYVDPNEAAWVEPDQAPEPPAKAEEKPSSPSPEPSDEEEAFDADGRRKQRSRRAKRKRVNYCVDGGTGAANDDVKDSETWQTSSRGRVRKVRKMDDNFVYDETEDAESQDRTRADGEFSPEKKPRSAGVSPAKPARFARPAGSRNTAPALREDGQSDGVAWESYRRRMIDRDQAARRPPRPARITEPSPAWNSELPILNENLGDRVSRIRSEIQRKFARRPAVNAAARSDSSSPGTPGASGDLRRTAVPFAGLSPRPVVGRQFLVNRPSPLGGGAALTKVMHMTGNTNPFVLRMGRDGKVFMDKVEAAAGAGGEGGAGGSGATPVSTAAGAVQASGAAGPVSTSAAVATSSTPGTVTSSKVTVVLPCKDPSTGNTMYMRLPPDQANSILQSLNLPTGFGGSGSGATVTTFTAAVTSAGPILRAPAPAPTMSGAPIRLSSAAAAAVAAVPAETAAPFRALVSQPTAQFLGTVSMPVTAAVSAGIPILTSVNQAPVLASAPFSAAAQTTTPVLTSLPSPAKTSAPAPVLSAAPAPTVPRSPVSTPSRIVFSPARTGPRPAPPLLSPPPASVTAHTTTGQPPHRSVLMHHVQSLPVPPGSPRPTLREPLTTVPAQPPPPPPVAKGKPATRPRAPPAPAPVSDVAARVRAMLQEQQAKGPLHQQQARQMATQAFMNETQPPPPQRPVFGTAPILQHQLNVGSPRKQHVIRTMPGGGVAAGAVGVGSPGRPLVLAAGSPRALVAAQPAVLGSPPTLIAGRLSHAPPTLVAISSPQTLITGGQQTATFISVSQPAVLTGGGGTATYIGTTSALLTAAPPLIVTAAAPAPRPAAPLSRPAGTPGRAAAGPPPMQRAPSGPPPMQRAPRYVSSTVQFVSNSVPSAAAAASAAACAAATISAAAAAAAGPRPPAPVTSQEGKIVIIKSGAVEKLGVLMPNGQIVELTEKQANAVKLDAVRNSRPDAAC